jgi:hypothetical protein
MFAADVTVIEVVDVRVFQDQPFCQSEMARDQGLG